MAERPTGARLRLEFDRGTLIALGSPPADPRSLPGMRWDERVDRYRAPARCYAHILARAAADGTPLDDAVQARLGPLGGLRAPPLRPYQAAALDAWDLAHRRGLVVLPTGSGKTHVALAAIAALGRSALCLVPTRVLLEQWSKTLAAALGVDVGRYGDGERLLRPITVATFESAYRHMHALGNRFELLVVDEVHHFGSGVRDEALEMSTAPARLGLSATPARGAAAARLDELVGPLVYELSIADLTGRFLARFELVDLHLDLTPDERDAYERSWRAYASVFEHYRDLAPKGSWSDFLRWAARTPEGRAAVRGWRRARALLALTRAKGEAVGALLRRHRDARVLVFTASREAALRIAREELVMPITADIERRERDAMLAAFRSGRLRALVSPRVLNEGLDVPAADVGIVVGGAFGEREHTQRVGRLLRPAPGKCALVYELVTRDTFEVGQARRKRRGIRASCAEPL